MIFYMNRLGGGQNSMSLENLWNATDTGKRKYSEKVYTSGTFYTQDHTQDSLASKSVLLR